MQVAFFVASNHCVDATANTLENIDFFCVQRFSTTAGQSGRPHLKIMSKQDFSMLSKKQVHFVV